MFNRDLTSARALGLELPSTLIASRWGDRVSVDRNGHDCFPRLVQKIRQALTFLATIGHDHHSVKTLAVISILAPLTISGAAYTDQF